MNFVPRLFEELTLRELHEILRLRAEVFVVEQKCVYADPDSKDFQSIHIQGIVNNQLKGYCRIIPPGVSYPEASIGRVVIAAECRGSGKGKELMLFAIGLVKTHFPAIDIVISAQRYLERFYGELGFFAEGNGYLEDDIPHIKMRLKDAIR